MEFALVAKLASQEAAKEVARLLNSRAIKVEAVNYGREHAVRLVVPSEWFFEQGFRVGSADAQGFAAWAVESGTRLALVTDKLTCNSRGWVTEELSSEQVAELANATETAKDQIVNLIQVALKFKGYVQQMYDRLLEVQSAAGVPAQDRFWGLHYSGAHQIVAGVGISIRDRDERIAKMEGTLASTSARLAECEQELRLLKARHSAVANQRNRALRSLRRARRVMSIA